MWGESVLSPVRSSRSRGATVLILGCLLAMQGFLALCPVVGAEPTEPVATEELIRPLPVVVPRPSNWAPKFPFPYSETAHQVTEADVSAEREMCQWFTAQYDLLNDQIGRLQFNRISPDGS